MSQVDSGPRTQKIKPGVNIYSALAFVAFVALAAAVGVAWYKNVELTEGFQEGQQFADPTYLVTPEDLNRSR